MELLETDAIAALTSRLVAIRSMNPSLVRGEGVGEARVAAFARDWLEEQGVRAWLEEVAPERPNVVAEVVGGPGPTLVFCAHLDTVGVEGMIDDPFVARRAGNRLHGRGAYDMKGSAAAIMCVAATLAGTRFDGRVMLALVADEEVASLGAQDFVQRHTADACILTEASANQLVLAHKGFVWAEITSRGVAAHGSRWEVGRSAISASARVIAALDVLDREILRGRTHPLCGPASLHCSMISGGSGISTYAPECRVQVERRTLPGEANADVLAEIERRVHSADPDAEVRLILRRPPLSVPADAPLARCVREAAREVRGLPPADIGVAYWMDSAVFSAAGIPTVNYGPAGDGAHAADEWVDLDSLAECARVYLRCARSHASFGNG